MTEPDYSGIPLHWMTYMAVAGIGKLAVVTDSTGAMIGLSEPDADHALAGQPH